jgi:hypothetical protein
MTCAEMKTPISCMDGLPSRFSSAVKGRQPNQAHQPLVPWQFSSRRPAKCLQPHAPLRQDTWGSNPPFPLAFLGSFEPACGMCGYSHQQCDGAGVPQSLTETGTAFSEHPIYVRFVLVFKHPNLKTLALCFQRERGKNETLTSSGSNGNSGLQSQAERT